MIAVTSDTFQREATMQFFKRFSVFTAAASLTACGAYFVETDILKAAHFEGALLWRLSNGGQLSKAQGWA